MDELAEFSRRILDALRQPIEDKKVSISRVNGTLSRERPGARLLLIMKPPNIVTVHFLSTKWSKKLFTINHYELQNGKCIVTPELSTYVISNFVDKREVKLQIKSSTIIRGQNIL